MIKPNPLRFTAANDRQMDPAAAPLPVCRCGTCRFWIEPVASARPVPALAVCIVWRAGKWAPWYTPAGSACGAFDGGRPLWAARQGVGP
ncbi:MAG: hypothetical protein ABI790_02440 [Betaproteobacteria bacterium]